MADKARTLKQNKALHLLFEMIASELNSAGYDMKRTLKAEIDIPWTKDTVKEYLFKPILKAYLNKDSTTEMTTKEINLVFETLNRHLGDKLGVYVNFPSIDEIIHKIRK